MKTNGIGVRLHEQCASDLCASCGCPVNLSREIPLLICQCQFLPDGSYSILYVNERIIEVFGVTPEEARCNPAFIFELVHPHDRRFLVASIKESAMRLTPWLGEFRVVVPEQQIRWIEAEAAVRKLESGGVMWSGYARDISERKTLEQELWKAQEELAQMVEERTDKLVETNVELLNLNKEVREEVSERIRLERRLKKSYEILSSLAIDLVLSEERERRRIAVELHDDVVQYLALGKLRLDMMMRDITPTPDLLKALTELIVNAMQQIRRICNDLSPPLLYDLGLFQAVDSLGERLAKEHRFRFILKGSLEDVILSDHLRTVLYQTARELLINVVKHASASNVIVLLQNTTEIVKMTVIDNGIGFPISRINGFGLSHVQQRIEFLKGSFSINSVPGRKTLVTVIVPLSNEVSNKRAP